MLSWDVPAAELDDLIQYVKAFAPRWRNEQPGEAIVAPPDPWADREADGIDRGRRVYHGLAQCATACHPAYATKQEIYDFTKELTKMELREMRGDLYFAVAKDSDYGVKILPPDFTFNEMRGGEALEDIYRAIASGIGGTAMPTWKNVLPDPDLWAMAHYVRSLVALRGTPEAAALRAACSTNRPGRPHRCRTPVPTARPTEALYCATCCLAKSRSAVLETATEIEVGTLTAFHSTENVRLPDAAICVYGPCSSNSRKPAPG